VSTRRLMASVVLLAWAGALGWLGLRQLSAANAPDLAAETLRVQPGSAFYAVLLGDRQIGTATRTIDTLMEGIRASERFDLELPVGGPSRRIFLWSDALLSRKLRLRSFSSGLRGEGPAYFIEGAISDSSVAWTLARRRGERGDSFATAGDPTMLLPGAVALRVAFSGRMALDERFALPVFDPLTERVHRLRAHVAAESTLVVPDSARFDSTAGIWVAARWDTLPAWRLDVEGDGLPAQLWIDSEGQIIEGVTALGYRLRRSAFEIVNGNFRGTMADTAAARGGSVLASAPAAAPASRARLAVQVDLAGGDSVAWARSALVGGRQRLRGDTLIVEREKAGGAALRSTYALPDTVVSRRPMLAAEPLVPADNPRVMALARRIVAGSRAPDAAAAALVRWTATEMADDPASTASLDPMLALRTRRGSSAARALLFVALARASGLPARPVAGLVADAAGQWHPHSWAEVHLGDWVAVDPAFGTLPAGAGHLRLSLGGPGRLFELAALASRLRPRPLSLQDPR
jgi:transglutaminase-like putative cysteine protease